MTTNPPVPPDPLSHEQRRARRPVGASGPLSRSRRSKVVAGVCGGIAAFVGAPPNAVRALWLLSLLPSLGITALAYPALWVLLPLEDDAARPSGPDSDEQPHG